MVLLAANVAALAWSCDTVADEWPWYGHDPGGTRYSPLTQINRENVSTLKVAWTFHTGEISDGRGGRKRSGFETTPLVVDGTLYLTTPFNRVIALDPETGAQRWAYDPKVDLRRWAHQPRRRDLARFHKTKRPAMPSPSF
jgi:quinoprotein glucose dehydrogenase